jgi:hypothetical protein
MRKGVKGVKVDRWSQILRIHFKTFICFTSNENF